MNRLPVRLALIFLASLAVVSICEVAKQFCLPGISTWLSHGITVLFVSILITAAAYGGLRLYDRLQEYARLETARGQALQAEIREKESLAVALRHQALTFENMFDAVVLTDPHSGIIDWNPAAERMFGYPKAEVLGKTPNIIHCSADIPALQDSIIAGLLDKGRWEGEVKFVRKDGFQGWAEVIVVAVYNDAGEMTTTVGVNRDITARKQAEAAEHEQRSLAEALRDTAALLSSTLDYNEVLDCILQVVERVVPHDAANFMLVEAGTARVIRGKGYERLGLEQLTREVRFSVSETPSLRWLVESNKPLIISDTAAEVSWIVTPVSTWIRSYIGAPLRSKGQTIGLLNLDSATAGFYTQVHADRLMAFADQAVAAIENARLFGEVQDFSRQMALLNDITRLAISAPDVQNMFTRWVDRLGELIHADGAYISLWDEVNQVPVAVASYGPIRQVFSLHQAAPGEPTLCGAVLKAGKPIQVEDVPASPYVSPIMAANFPGRSALGLPLKADGKELGAAILIFSDYHRFTPDEISICSQAADQIALAIVKTHSLQAERQRSAELARSNALIASLSQVASRLETTVDARQILEVVGSELKHLQVYCHIALVEDASGELVLRYTSFSSDVLQAISHVAGLQLRGYVVPRSAWPYEQMQRQRRSIYTLDARPIIAALLPAVPADSIDNILQVANLPAKTPIMCLQLTAHEQSVGALWMLGSDLRQDDLTAFSVFASQVAAALENSRLYRELQHHAITDELTGIYNRRGLFELGQREVERALRYQRKLSAIMIDIDHFKQVNDTYGHSIGDQVLRALAERCRRNIRDIDIVGRYGGEELVILLPEESAASAAQAAERLRLLIADTSMVTEHGPVNITVSLGVAELTSQIAYLASLIEYADQAMYQAKQSGRNRVAVYG